MSEEESYRHSEPEEQEDIDEQPEIEEPAAEEPKQEDYTKQTKNTKKRLGDRSIQGIQIFLVKNAYPRAAPKRYRAINLEKLLHDSVTILSLTSRASKIYTESGKVITTFDAIQPQETLYISCGEKFGHGMASPTKKRPPSHMSNAAPLSPRVVTEKDNEDQPPKPKEKKQLTAEEKKQKEIDSFQRLIAYAPTTYQEAMRDSSASMFASLTTGQRSKLTNAEELEVLHNDTQQYYLINALTKCSICPGESLSDVNDLINQYCINLYKGMDPEDIKFVVVGPHQSGKSSLVYLMTTILNRKFQVCDEFNQNLFFTINFEQETLYMNECTKLLHLFVNRTFECAYFSNMALVPCIAPLQQWFISQITGTNPLYPSVCDLIPCIDSKMIFDIVKLIKNAQKSNEVDALAKFVQLACDVPALIGEALGFKKVVYVIDSFEYSNVKMYQQSGQFLSKGNVFLASHLCNSLDLNYYIVSMENEQLFMECFTCNDALLIDADKIAESYGCPARIEIPNLSFCLTIKDCSGCPGYIIQFLKLVNLIQQYTDNSAVKSRLSLVQATPDHSRLKIIRLQLSRLCLLIENAGHSRITKELLNKINDEDIQLNIKVTGYEKKEHYSRSASDKASKHQIEEEETFE